MDKEYFFMTFILCVICMLIGMLFGEIIGEHARLRDVAEHAGSGALIEANGRCFEVREVGDYIEIGGEKYSLKSWAVIEEKIKKAKEEINEEDK